MSEIAIALFFGLGFLLATVGYIWGLVQAFQEEVVWGLLYWFIPFAALVFYIKKWSNKKIRKTLLIQLAAWPIFLLGGIITMVSYGAEFAKLAQSGTITVQPESSEQSPSSFPSDFSISSSPTPEQSPIPEPSTELSPAPIPEPSFGTVGGQPGNFKQLMKLGYAYYGQGDYQTALINFNRALQMSPGNTYAVKAVDNTKKAIAQAKAK
ncbi:tetratricopeptide repeat protein [Microcoleus sp. herbarium14]|uniref:tetratricopeptide repeat protein n=1 Tax=Microcoleus sp. herbarium14 TaxID=3055439 RepID=UPI002FD40E74